MAKRQERVEAAATTKEAKMTLVNKQLKLRIDDLFVFDALTDTQKTFYNLYKKNLPIMMLHGVAGTGKTFIALYKALEETMDRSTQYEKVLIVRSAVPSREIGHLPGDEAEKTEVYTQPYVDICSKLFGRHDAFLRLKEQQVISFVPTSFIRGMTWDDCIVIVDEVQNMNEMELHTIITRLGDRSKIIFCGDYRQNDLQKKNDMSGLKKFMNILKMMKHGTGILEFGVDDIVRNSIIKDYIIAKMNYEDMEKNGNSNHTR
jgi:predicted ribonuclease YlaK